MDKIEINRLDIESIVNAVFVDITMQMISVKMQRQAEFNSLFSKDYCFEIRTEGAFISLILFEMEEKVYERIATKLEKEEKFTIQEKNLYVIEYLNVICGRILSEINDRLGKRSKLSVPIRIEHEIIEQFTWSRSDLSYRCLDGGLNIIVYIEMKDNTKEDFNI